MIVRSRHQSYESDGRKEKESNVLPTLCEKLNLGVEEVISQALSLLQQSLHLQENGYQIVARRERDRLCFRLGLRIISFLF
jgi:hypothetical protein